jgi:hypothetical protein
MNTKDCLIELSKNHQNICINLTELLDMMKDGYTTNEYAFYDPEQDKKIRDTGLFGKIGDCKIWCSYIIQPKHYRTAESDITNAKDENQWSVERPLSIGEK